MTGRPTIAYIDLNALEHNLSEVRRLTGGRGVLGVVKADAYGHGAVEVARRLEALGVEMLGVALVEEGIELRAHGIKSPILVLGGVFMDQTAALIANGLAIALYTAPLAEAISRAAVIAGVKVPAHVKVDTGMGRVGVSPAEAADFVKAISRLPGLEVAGLMTHLSDVGDADKSFAEFQINQFSSVIDALKAEGLAVPLIHAAGSAAVIDFAPALFNLTRPGIMLYGCYPSEHMKPLLSLAPVMSVKTKIMHLKKVEAGKPISYGRTFYTMRKSLIATLPIGYADGLSRGLSNKGHILIGGRRCPIVGTVCMDLTMVDVTEVADVKVGDEAVFIGRQGSEIITAEEVAGLLGTISYEVLCGISKRVKREYE